MSQPPKPANKPSRRKPKPLDVSMEELDAILERASTGPLSEEDRGKLRAVFETLRFITDTLEKKGASIARLKRMLFGASTEKTSLVAARVSNEPTPAVSDEGAEKGKQAASEEKKKRKGHGRNGAAAYTGAERICVDHETLKPGDSCPACGMGKAYKTAEPELLVRVTGRPPVDATVYELEKLRCNLCGELFTARAPEGVGDEKYDARSASMIALLKYGCGLPFNRLDRLQKSLGIPLPSSNQWEIVDEAAQAVEAAGDELVRQAAQGEVLHNDDTTMRVLELMGPKAKPSEVKNKDGSPRKGVSTSGIVSLLLGHRIALFFTGLKHAGENLADVLKKRAAELARPIQMCDALSRNMSDALKTIVANCLVHGRGNFVDVAPKFPESCLYVLKILKEVYQNDAQTKREKMTKQQRLRFHQAHSAKPMKRLKDWLDEQIEKKRVEPNSGLGDAIQYMRNHWKPLTLFLRVPGAPLDNNICERVLKKAILHRKNALFYKTENGARVGDLFMSLIHTCELNKANPFDYLTELQKNKNEVSSNPANWMPWNYRETLARLRAIPPT